MKTNRTYVVAAAIWTAALLFGARLQAAELLIAPGARISVADFGAIPNDGQNDAPALRKALEFCKNHPGIILYFPPGVYNFRDESAVQLMDQAMTGQFGRNPENTLFKPYYPYPKGLDFQGLSGITIEAKGAVLLIDGWMEPISLDRCKDITIRGLTVDYKRKPYSSGVVVRVGAGYFDSVIENQYSINARMPIPRVMFWNSTGHQMIGESDATKIKLLAPQSVRVYASELTNEFLTRIKGNEVALVHSMHFRPAILIEEADNIRLEDVTIHSQPGMGIVGHRANNITLIGLRVVPSPGSFVSTTTDATHFTSCTGLIRIENSQFEGHGDDAINIHNYYYSVAKGGQEGLYNLGFPLDNMHAGVIDYPDVGDSLELVDSGSLEPVRSFVVESVAIHPQEMRTVIGLNASLPDDLDKYYLIDITRLPKVEIVGNSFLSHRARGALIKTRNVLIERNLFLENTGTAIQVAAEGGCCREGVPSANVVIRNNRMIGNGRGAGAIAGTSGIVVNIDAKTPSGAALHHGLLIEGNTIDGAGTDKCILISQADNVEIRYNEFSGCRAPISTEYSEHINIHDNTTATGPAAQALSQASVVDDHISLALSARAQHANTVD